MNPGKIVFVSKGKDKPSTRYRAQQFEQLLKNDGWQIQYVTASGNIFNKIKVLKYAYSSDVTVVLRKNFSLFFFKALRLLSKKLVFDFDDANFMKPDGSESSTRYASFKRFMRESDQVWAGNHYLANEAKKFTQRVSIVPTSIDPEKYKARYDKPENSFDLVWIGSRSTSNYIKSIIPVLEKAASNIHNLRLKIIADFSVKSNKIEIISIPWSTDIEVKELTSSHVGLSPMPDTPWTRGKCALKVLQYMASELPVISSNAGVNAEVLKDKITGYLADSEQEWIDAIEDLNNNKTLLETMGQKSKDFVSEHYSINAVYKIIAADLNKM